MNLPNYLGRSFFKWLSSFVVALFPNRKLDQISFHGQNAVANFFTVKMHFRLISTEGSRLQSLNFFNSFAQVVSLFFPLTKFVFLFFPLTHSLPGVSTDSCCSYEINPLIFWINQIWVIGSSYNGIFATKCKRRRQPWNCTVLICFCLLTCFFPSFGLFFVVETFPDLLKTISLFCFCLLTCLLSLFKSFPRQGGLIGTRDFGLAGADLEINDSWELNSFINFI